MPREFVNRRDKDYHRFALQNKTDLDRIASYLLAINYSRRNLAYSSQNLVQMDCVAVCMTTEGLWVASNSQKITDDDIENLRCELPPEFDNIYIIKNGVPYIMHAEMQLVQELEVSGFRTTAIGVSKPCCEECKKVLDEWKIEYSMYHNSHVKNWENPFPDN